MKPAVIQAVCRVHQLVPDAGTVGVTAIDKRPVEGSVRVRRLGLHGDVQADRANHGGEDKAVYAYSASDAEWWAEELGRPLPPGCFGENLRIAGLETGEAVIGERWRTSGGVVLEVTMPRIPCATFGRWLGEERWARRFTQEGRPGAYLRVVDTGEVAAGDGIAVVHTPAHGVTVGEWFRGPTRERAEALLDADAEGGIRIAPALRAYVEAAARRADPLA
ncbi:MOSC domain-containing protein [Sinomonas halotolerans]|uniref:MOSC domain-containing protein n=1 Tax=Sinomonas halotolerans TaxID=1644133 RepID=A0ABU9X106_9MICC